MIPIYLSFKLKILIKKGLKCDLILKHLVNYQYSVLFVWPVEMLVFLVLLWIYYKSLPAIIIEVVGISIALLFELNFLFLIRKMINLEITGDFYCLENIGKKVPDTEIVNANIDTLFICDTSLAQVVIALPIKTVRKGKSHPLPQNIEFDIKDFSNK